MKVQKFEQLKKEIGISESGELDQHAFELLNKKLNKIPINTDVQIIFINLKVNCLLKLNKLSFFKKINNNIPLIHDDIDVAIGIIIKPISLK